MRMGSMSGGLGLLGLAAVIGTAAIARQDPAKDNPPAESPASKLPALRDGFEDGLPRWREEEIPSDASFLLRAHERSDEGAREGRYCERFEFEAGPGSVLYYSYPLPRVPVTAELSASLFARSNRPGVQLYAHVVLPNDKDPDTGQPTFLLIPGTSIETPERWQRLRIANLPLALERQARVLRTASERTVSTEGAYLDRLVINLYGGAGESEVEIDDLVVEPVLVAEGAQAAGAATPAANAADVPKGATARVALAANHLVRNGDPWIPRGISAPLSEMASLRRAGFDVLEVPRDADKEILRKAVSLGYTLMPRADVQDDPGKGIQVEDPRDIAFWGLGGELGRPDTLVGRKQELEDVRRFVSALRSSAGGASQPLVLGTVSDMFPQYALFGRNLDVIAVEPIGLASSIEPMSTLQHLNLCRALTSARNPNATFWAWVPASAPPILRRAIWGDDPPPAWGWPEVQPEQIRMYTYAALMAGYRGIGFRADAELARETGLDRLYELTMLVAEIELVEEILARGSDPIAQWPAFPPNPEQKLIYNSNGRAGAFTNNRNNQTKPAKEVSALPTVRVTAIDSVDHRTKLLVVADLAQGAQWQPPQMAYHNLNLVVPAAESAQAFEIVLGDDIRKLESKRDAGGRRITVPLMNATTLVLVTTDFAFVERLRGTVMALRPKVVDLAIRQAEMRLDQVMQITGALRSRGIVVKDQDDLLTNVNLQSATTFLKNAREARDRADYETAWNEARSVALPIRLVYRAHFEKAFNDFNRAVNTSLRAEVDPASATKPAPLWVGPISCPPLVCNTTLPQYYYWREFMSGERGEFGANKIETGSFETTPTALRAAGWADASHPQEGLKGSIRVEAGAGYGMSGSALKLVVKPTQQVDKDKFVKDGQLDRKAYIEARRAALDALPPASRWPVAAVRSPEIPVRARDFVRIRVKVRMPQSQAGGGSGLIVRDSIGGEVLQFSTNDAIREYREIVLFRRVPEDSDFTVTLGLAGQGEAYFDDLKVEILGQSDSEASPTRGNDPLARQPSAPSPLLPAGESNDERMRR